MPIVKTNSYHEGGRYASCMERRDYLEKDCRHIYRDTINVARPDSWDLELDLSRKIYSLHGNRTYKEYVLSPKDTDNATVEQVRSFAFEWASTNFPEYEVVIVLHDDNRGRIQRGEEGIPHAHVIVNMINLVTEKKLRMPMERVRELHNSAQRIAARMGISRLEDYERGVWKESHREYRFSPREHQMKLQGMDTWKAVMKDMTEQALEHARNLNEFRECLRRADIDMEIKRNQIRLIDRANHDRAVKAEALSRSLTLERISRRFEERRERERSSIEREREERNARDDKREIQREYRVDHVEERDEAITRREKPERTHSETIERSHAMHFEESMRSHSKDNRYSKSSRENLYSHYSIDRFESFRQDGFEDHIQEREMIERDCDRGR